MRFKKREKLLKVIQDKLMKYLFKRDHALFELSPTDAKQEENMIPTIIVAGASMSRIDAVFLKVYWERKFTKENIIAMKNKLGITLSDEYEEKLDHLDDIRPGEDVSLPPIVVAERDADNGLLLKLSVYFTDENVARRFLNAIRDANDKETIAILKSYRDKGFCRETSKALWRLLHDGGLYDSGYTNWNAQLNKP